MSNPEQPSKNTRLKLHPIVEKLVDNPNAPPALTHITGYVGRSSRAGYIRIYDSLDLNEYTDVPESAIRHVTDVPESEMEHGGTRIWVDNATQVIHESREVAQMSAGELDQPVTSSPLETKASRKLKLNRETLQALSTQALAMRLWSIPANSCDLGVSRVIACTGPIDCLTRSC